MPKVTMRKGGSNKRAEKATPKGKAGITITTSGTEHKGGFSENRRDLKTRVVEFRK